MGTPSIRTDDGMVGDEEVNLIADTASLEADWAVVADDFIAAYGAVKHAWTGTNDWD
jgi:hypothetical protein